MKANINVIELNIIVYENIISKYVFSSKANAW